MRNGSLSRSVTVSKVGSKSHTKSHSTNPLLDKTQVYHDQIEVKQKELQPWTAKINAKRAEIDVATSERDMLAKKAEEAQKASENAQTELDQLREDQEAKVYYVILFLLELCSFPT